MSAAALGFAPHSGWAAVVVLGGSRAQPRVVARSRVELADERDAGSKQPYHAIEGLPVPQAARRLAAYEAAAERMAHAAVQGLLDEVRRAGYRPSVVGIVDASGRRGGSLASILASHALIHTADGDHVRKALATAAEGAGLRVVRIPLRDLDAHAEAALGRPPSDVHDAVKELGRTVGPPWGADQKAAALLAWVLL